MKKITVLILLSALICAICVTAGASQEPLRQYPMPTTVTQTVMLTDVYPYKGANAGRLYIRHYLWSSQEGYYGDCNFTNYFQATTSEDTNKRLGGNWMTPGTANYVRSGSIAVGKFYGVAGRGNTKYADAGISVVRVSGYMDSDS